MTRLNAASQIASNLEKPGYDPAAHAAGIVHIGVGAFHKAHQAVYTDTALAVSGGDWRIVGVSLRSADVAAALNPQDGRYIMLTRDEAGDTARLVASIEKVLVAPENPQAVIDAIANPATKIVTLTVTEKAYGIDRSTGGLDHAHPAISHDLAAPAQPTGVIGFLVAGLAARKATDTGGLTVLCCDNLPENGHVVAKLVQEFATLLDPSLAKWINENASFPSSMVDRITPASTEKTFADAQSFSGYEDHAAIETEPFTQWVIEDNFRAGRPAWEKAGALFVENVAAYEKMKLRLLNGTHSLLAYAGFLAGYEVISETVRDAKLHAIAERQMIAASATLPPVPGISLADYRAQLLARFSNRSIRHLTYQIAMDGTEKLPQRILTPLSETIANGEDGAAFCFAIAAWMRYCLGVSDNGQSYALRDPREAVISECVSEAGRDAKRLYIALTSIPGLFDPALANNSAVQANVVQYLHTMLEDGMATALKQYE